MDVERKSLHFSNRLGTGLCNETIKNGRVPVESKYVSDIVD